MTIEGELDVTLAWDGATVREVSIRSTRTRIIGRVLRGREPEAAVDLVARLHGVCAHAQAAVAASALAAACGVDVPPAVRKGHAWAVRLEAVQEHCTRLGLDWAEVMDESPLIAAVRAVRDAIQPRLQALAARTAAPGEVHAWQALQDDIHGVVEATLLGMSCEAWLGMTSWLELDAWSRRAEVAPARWLRLLAGAPPVGASAVPALPTIGGDALASQILPSLRQDPQFAGAPTWQGQPAETGPLARMAEHPLVRATRAVHGASVTTRLVARLTELAWLVCGDVDLERSIQAIGADGEGCAATSTARGVLVHRAVLSNGRVADYAIVAPTEWNFHPRGSFVAGLQHTRAPSAEALRKDARRAAQALDPCVACRIVVGHA